MEYFRKSTSCRLTVQLLLCWLASVLACDASHAVTYRTYKEFKSKYRNGRNLRIILNVCENGPWKEWNDNNSISLASFPITPELSPRKGVHNLLYVPISDPSVNDLWIPLGVLTRFIATQEDLTTNNFRFNAVYDPRQSTYPTRLVLSKSQAKILFRIIKKHFRNIARQ